MKIIGTITGNTLSIPFGTHQVKDERAGIAALAGLASALTGQYLDPGKIPAEINDVIFIHLPGEHFAVLMRTPDGLQMGIESWAAFHAEHPDVAAGIRQLVQTVTAASGTPH